MVRLSTPSCTRKSSPCSGPRETRPRVGFRPTRPQQAAGIRIEPPPSLPWAIGTMPEATAEAAPPEDPPGVREVSHGLRAGPKRRGSLTGRIPNSGMLVLPTITKPASRMRRVTNESCVGDEVAEQVGAEREGHPRHGGRVLHGDRNARERTRVARADGVRGRERALGVDVDERVELGLKRLDALERRLHELARGDLALADHPGAARPRA